MSGTLSTPFCVNSLLTPEGDVTESPQDEEGAQGENGEQGSAGDKQFHHFSYLSLLGFTAPLDDTIIAHAKPLVNNFFADFDNLAL